MRNVPKTEPSVCDSWQYFTLSPLVYLTLIGGYRLSLGLFNDKESYVQSYLLPDPTHLTPTFFFFANKCTLYSSLIAAAVELSLSENKLGFFGLTRTFFCFAASAFLSVDIKGFQKSFDIALFFFLSPQLCSDAASLPQTGSVLAHSFVSLLLSRSIAP